MLVLSRKIGQTLKIGDDITVTVLSVRGNVVRVGVEAPRHVRVLRGELEEWSEDDAVPPGRRTVALAT